MTDVVSFVTPGLIDQRAITTAGVSVKEGENPIGMFGTGLKYAIAIILRLGGEVTVWRGVEPLRFGVSKAEIRGKPFDVVTMNGVELGFTTDLGRHWEAWQAFRELHSNTLDEGGETSAGARAPHPEKTTIVVALREIAEAFAGVGSYFLQTEPIHVAPLVDFHPGPGTGVFYRGVKITESWLGKPFRFVPNLTGRLQLTEDRTAKSIYDVARVIAGAVLGDEDAGFIERFICADEDDAEHDIDLDWSHPPSKAFLETVERLMRDPARKINVSSVKVAARHARLPEPLPVPLFSSEEEALGEAIRFCKALGYAVDEYPITVVETLGMNVLGRARRSPATIFLAKAAFGMGDRTLAGTLVEEWAHIKHGIDDFTRGMQNWLLDQLMRIGAEALFLKGRNDG